MKPYTSKIQLSELPLWEKFGSRRIPLDFTLEITARCNNNCRHCYINLPSSDKDAKEKELTLAEINNIADQAVELGAVWCLISGSEPLLRMDFPEIYLSLRKKGLLVSVFTNACLINNEHIELFKKYPPRDIEVTVYGITEGTYERVTRKKGSFKLFMRGLDLLLKNKINVRLKAMALRSNIHELPEITKFCRENTMDFYRFDPLLNLRHDGDPLRNEEIRHERLTPEEIADIEQKDEERANSLEHGCEKYLHRETSDDHCDHLFFCGAGNGSFVVGYDGVFRLCSSLCDPESTFDLRKGTLKDAWFDHTIHVRERSSSNQFFLENCQVCPIINLCMYCPANAHLEMGELDGFSIYFCDVAHARANAIQDRISLRKPQNYDS